MMECCLETNPSSMPMPPPKSAGATLKKLALETVQSWAKEFGSAYKKLALGYNYLKQVKRFTYVYIDTFELKTQII